MSGLRNLWKLTKSTLHIKKKVIQVTATMWWSYNICNIGVSGQTAHCGKDRDFQMLNTTGEPWWEALPELYQHCLVRENFHFLFIYIYLKGRETENRDRQTDRHRASMPQMPTTARARPGPGHDQTRSQALRLGLPWAWQEPKYLCLNCYFPGTLAGSWFWNAP